MSEHFLDSELLFQRQNGVVGLFLNRPTKRNALSLSLLRSLLRQLEVIARDRSIRVVVLGATGSVFCSGHDLSEMLDRSEIEYRTLFSLCSQVMLALRQLPQPVIARVHGHATAAGCQLVASCDLAVASEAATFATPGVKIGLFCTTPMIPLVRAIAPKQAFEMLMTAKPISADEAQRRGLINRVVPLHQLDAAIQELTDAIVAASYEIVRLGKRAFYATATLDEADAYTIASEVMTANAMLPDAVEGIAAFLQKRKPVWPSTLTTEPTEPSSA